MTREDFLKRKVFLKQQYISIIQDEIKLLRIELSQIQGYTPNKADPNPPVIELPTTGGETFAIYPADVTEWMSAYPKPDILQELKNMVQWLRSNPRKQKTQRGCRRFITSWLGRAQNDSRTVARTSDAIDTRPLAFPMPEGYSPRTR